MKRPRHSRIIVSPWFFAALALAVLSFGWTAFISHATVTLNGTSITGDTSFTSFGLLGTPASSTSSSLFHLGPNAINGSPSGTFIGINPSAFSGDFLNFEVNSSSVFKVDSAGNVSATAVQASILDAGGRLFDVKAYGAKGDGSTDDSSAVSSTISAAIAAGGGTIYFPPGTYLLGSPISIPYTAGTPPIQVPLRFTGAMPDMNGASWGAAPQHGTLLNLTETSNSVAKIDTRGAGYLEIDHLSLEDTGSDSVPFIQTTNTTVHVHDCGFTSSQSGTSNVQDAIILGGSSTSTIGTASANAPFQGYGTVIMDNFFNRVRHAVVGNAYANGVQILDNTIGQGSGSATSGDAPIRFNGAGTGSESDSGDFVAGNLIEETNYYYGIRLSLTEDSTVIGNSGFDSGSSTTADVYLDTGSDTETISCGQTAVNVCVDPNSPGLSANDVNVLSAIGGRAGNNFSLAAAQVPINDCFWIGGTNGECIYGNGSNVFFRYQYDNSTDMTLNSSGWLGILNTQPYEPLDVTGAIRTRPESVASSTCSATVEGALQAFNDAATTTWGAAITGGGSGHVLGYCDGTSWTVMAK